MGAALAQPSTLDRCCRERCTEGVALQLRRQVSDREAGGWARIAWALEARQAVKTRQARLVVPPGGDLSADLSAAFAQITVEFNSRRAASSAPPGARLVIPQLQPTEGCAPFAAAPG